MTLLSHHASRITHHAPPHASHLASRLLPLHDSGFAPELSLSFLDHLLSPSGLQSLLPSVVVIVLYVVAVTWLRRKAGQGHPSFRSTDVKFKETKVSGFSDRSLATRMGGIRHGLAVTVLADAVLIEPGSIFKRLVPPNLNDFEFYVKKADVAQVEPDVVGQRKAVRLRFRAPDRTMRTVTLILKDVEGFVREMKG